MKCYLGIDGGGTKTKFILCDSRGNVLAEDTRSTSHYLQTGLPGLTRVLSEGLAEVLNRSGAQPEQVASAFVGLSGYGDVASDDPDIRGAVSRALGDIPHGIGNDSENALAGALAGACGINLICGTGSIACGRNPAGAVMRCGGWHHVIGSDEGSGYWMGVELLHAFTRQSDGRDPKTYLYDLIRSTLSLKEDDDVITRVIEDWGADRTKIAALSRLMGRLYDRGDPNAGRILDRAAAELADMAAALYRRLGFSGDVPVSYSGGVFNIGRPILEPLAMQLAALGMTLCAPKLPPDLGAVVLAFQYDGMPVPEGLTH